MSGSNERSSIHNILRIPFVYNLIQSLLGASNGIDAFIKEYVKPKEGDIILDFGAGTGAIYEKLKVFKIQKYIAIEINASYIAKIKERFDHNSKHIALKGSTEQLKHLAQKFDKILLIGVLHHLNRATINIVLSELPNYLKPGGKLVILDCVKHKKQNIISRLLVSIDRGRSVMQITEYERILLAHNKDFIISLRKDLLRVPYSQAISVLRI